MNLIFDFIADVIFGGVGAFIKKLFGRPLSDSGISEMWIGILVVAAVIACVITTSRLTY